MRRAISFVANWISTRSWARKFALAASALYLVDSLLLSNSPASAPFGSLMTSFASFTITVLALATSSRAPGVVTGFAFPSSSSLTRISACLWSASYSRPFSDRRIIRFNILNSRE